MPHRTETGVAAGGESERRAAELLPHLWRRRGLESGGGVAGNLEALYGYMLLRLPAVDANNDARVAEEVIELLEPLRASWNELAASSTDFRMDQQKIDAIAAVAIGSAA